jgi:hypothetical protein
MMRWQMYTTTGSIMSYGSTRTFRRQLIFGVHLLANKGGLSMNNWEDVSKTLESITKSFSKDSVQYKALEEAAWAFVFVNMDADVTPKFMKFRSDSSKELSESQKQHLCQMGIQP